jgi:hypothetical protein
MSNNTIRRIYEVTRKFLGKITGYSIFPLLYLLIFLVHAGIFFNAYLHIHLFESPEVYSALGKEERIKELRAITLVFCLVIYWFWQGVKLFLSKNKKNDDSLI